MSSERVQETSLMARWDEISSISTGDELLVTKVVYGNQGSMMVAERKAGYHSHPHIHDSEQLNYVIDGEIWIFAEKEGYFVQKGDFFRVPRMAIHWAWNRSDRPCTLIESHVPMLTFRPDLQKLAVGLFAAVEQPQPQGTSRNIFVDMAYATKVEKKLFGEQS